MDSGVILLLLAVFGSALVAGGIVAYRGGASLGGRALGASAAAAGVVMWAIVLVALPVSRSTSGEPSPTIEVQTPTD